MCCERETGVVCEPLQTGSSTKNRHRQRQEQYKLLYLACCCFKGSLGHTMWWGTYIHTYIHIYIRTTPFHASYQ